ncbi:unnamed protein product [Mucor hiemalis]
MNNNYLSTGIKQAPTNNFDEEEPPASKRAHAENYIPQEFVPDFRSLGRNQNGFATEIGTSDADKIKQAIMLIHR